MLKRRYEMLLPLKYNDGREINLDLFRQTRRELSSQFGAISSYPGIVLGEWEHEGQRYEDELVRWVIDVEDTPENRAFFIGFKKTLLERFEQLEIYIVSHPIDVL